MPATYYKDGTNGTTVRAGEGDGKELVIADFFPEVTKVLNRKKEAGVEKIYRVEFYNADGLVATRELSPKELVKVDYSEIDDSLLLRPTVASAAKEMAYYIKSQAKRAENVESIFFDKLGWHFIDGKRYYCAGNVVLGTEGIVHDGVVVSNELQKKYHLEIDENLSEENAAKQVWDYINIKPRITAILFVSGLLGVMHQIVLDAGLKIPCVTYLYGPSQTRKTTVSIFGTRFYNRSNLNDVSVTSLRVSSTKVKTEELADELKDATFVLDDLFQDPSVKQRKEYEGRVRNVIRNLADNSSRTTSRSAFKNNSNVVVTAEYLMESLTDVGRMFLIKVEKPLDSEKISVCQMNPLGISTFYYYFITWLAENYDSTVDQLKHDYAEFRRNSANQKRCFERLYEQGFLLTFAFNIFLQYLEVNSEEAGRSLEDKFADFIIQTIKEQCKIMRGIEMRAKKDINFSAEILTLLQKGEIQKGKKGENCYIKDNDLYIVPGELVRLLSKKYGRSFSVKEINKYFRDKFMAEVYSDNRLKKHNNKRYLVLNLKDLQSDARECEGYVERFLL